MSSEVEAEAKADREDALALRLGFRVVERGDHYLSPFVLQKVTLAKDDDGNTSIAVTSQTPVQKWAHDLWRECIGA